MTEGPAQGREWLRAAGLLALALSLAPVGPIALLTVPMALLGASLGGWRGGLVALPALLVAWGAGVEPGLWFLERGWAFLAGAWFLALTLRWPDLTLIGRGIGAVVAAVASAAAVLFVTPGGFTVAEWAVRGRLEEGAAAAGQMLETWSEAGGTTGSTEALLNLVETQLLLFPALLGLATLASLGVAWWVVVRCTTGNRGVLGALSDFRFPDPLIWLFIAGGVLILLGGGGWPRVGMNAVAFMMPLYALRGAGVILGVRGGFSFWGWMLVAVGMIFAAPALLFGAFLVGLGDTWLDLRARAARVAD